jgi:putative acetyltransferase
LNGGHVSVDVLVRGERTENHHQVWVVNEAAFGHRDEADLVENLRAEGAVLLGLVGEVDGAIAGHILFSRMFIETAEGDVAAVALAPMAVLPQHQGKGIGSELVRQGLVELCARGERIVLVLGHKEYYPRFGFSCDKASGLSSPFPRDAYMALELKDGALAGVDGKVRYAAAFGL